MTHAGLTPVVVTDPPFNIGYRYKGFTDRMDEGDYYAMLAEVTAQTAAVVIHYPEQLHRLSIEKGEAPERVVSRVYNSNTRKQHRDVAFYGVKPDFNRVKQPYKNQNDKRIRKLMAEGKGARLYDWWNVNQVKNVSKVKTGHPCQMPIQVMKNIIGILPDGIGAIDPFLGSGTTDDERPSDAQLTREVIAQWNEDCDDARLGATPLGADGILGNRAVPVRSSCREMARRPQPWGHHKGRLEE